MTQTSSSTESLKVEIADGVARITLVGPGRGNAMGPEFWRELPRTMEELDADELVRVVVIDGKGRNFSVGLDLMSIMSEMGPLLQGQQLAHGRAKLRALIGRYQAAITSVEACAKPVIASISGCNRAIV